MVLLRASTSASSLMSSGGSGGTLKVSERAQVPEVPDERILRQRAVPAQARVTVFTRHGPLFMCGHHFRRHSVALEPLVFGAYDMVTGHPIRFRAPSWRA
jgi:hypothetical protein